MISTPIHDFVRDYGRKNPSRLHMPGHKGRPFLGCEALDITEIDGADDLFHPQGIIRESEENASRLFACPSYYSTEGSSLCIRTMLRLAMDISKNRRVLAGRNAHKAFLHTAVLLDLDVAWIYPEQQYLSVAITPEQLEQTILCTNPGIVYVTSPDYLGNLLDIQSLAEVCHVHNTLLLVDNAHGAYLKFLPEDQHPISLGADLCCDSAHKTLPVLTGGAYLHLAPKWEAVLHNQVKDTMALFGSTSPSYLILQSLDLANAYLQSYPEKLKQMLPKLKAFRESMAALGYFLDGDEILKLTIKAKSHGYSGQQLAEILQKNGIYSEFSDPDYLVLMLSAESTDAELQHILAVFQNIPRKTPCQTQSIAVCHPLQKMRIRDASFAPRELIPVTAAKGRILAAPTVSCPPAIPIVVCGEEIDELAISQMQYYGIRNCTVVVQP